MTTESRRTDEAAIVFALIVGNFVVGLSVLLVPGMLSTLAQGVGVSIPIAGQLITVASIVMGLGAPLGAAFTSRFDRRHLLTATMVLFVVGHLACALAPNYVALMIARALTVIGAALFTPQAAATVALLVPAQRRASSVAAIFIGWSVASVVAMPAINLVATQYGWRTPFFLASACAVIAALMVWRVVPAGLRVPPLAWRSWIVVAKHPVLPSILAITLINMAAQFTVFSYMVPIMDKALGASSTLIAIAFFAYGVTGVLGNALTVKWLPRLGAAQLILAFQSMLVVSLVMWGIALQLSSGAMALVILAMLLWGLCGFACNSTQQGRLLVAAPELASATIALNTSFLYIGQAFGTLLGAWLISHIGYAALPWVGALLMLGALGMSFFAGNLNIKNCRIR